MPVALLKNLDHEVLILMVTSNYSKRIYLPVFYASLLQLCATRSALFNLNFLHSSSSWNISYYFFRINI